MKIKYSGVPLCFVICQLKDKVRVQTGLWSVGGSLTCVSASDLLDCHAPRSPAVVAGPRQPFLPSRVPLRSSFPSPMSKAAKTDLQLRLKTRKSFQNLLSFGHKYKESSKIMAGRKTHIERPHPALGEEGRCCD